MIDTTLGVLLTAKPALDRLATQKLPVKTAYRLAKLLKRVSDETRTFEEQRNAWIKELGEPTEDGNVTVKAQHVPEFVSRVNELTGETVKVDMDPVSLDGLGELSAVDALALGPFVVEPD